MSDTHYKFIANHLIFPLLFLFVAWSAAGFPVADGEKWGRIAQMFLAIYVPLKLTKILIHKRSGVLRHCDRARIAAASLLFVLWLVCAVVGFLQHGLLRDCPQINYRSAIGQFTVDRGQCGDARRTNDRWIGIEV